MKIKKICCVLLSGLLFSTATIAADTTGNISILRATTDLTSASQQRMLFIQLSAAFHVSCTWVTVGTGNDYFASILLSAEAQKSQVRIWYDDVNADANKLCKANTIQIIP